MKPLNVTTVPLAVNSALSPLGRGKTAIFAVVVETFASCIWLAIVLFQIRS